MRIVYPRNDARRVACDLPRDMRVIAPDGSCVLIDPSILVDGPREIAVPLVTSTGRRRGTRRWIASPIIAPDAVELRIVGVSLAYPTDADNPRLRSKSGS